ncbi:unnamed protein product, partial [Closterium sp. NIES-54]
MRKLLRGMRLPNHQWPEAMDHAVMLHNLLSSSSLPNNASPHLLWTRKQGSTKMLRVFGCMAPSLPSLGPTWPLDGPVAAPHGPATAPYGPVAAPYGPVAAPQRPRCRPSAASSPPFAALQPFLGPSAALPGPIEQPSRPGRCAVELPSRRAAEPPCSRDAELPSRHATAAKTPQSLPAWPCPCRLASARPTCLGRAVDFEVWVDDLQLFLQYDRADGLSLFDLTSGASPAPAADADATVRSQWATRDAAACLAVHRHLPTAERAHFSQYKSAKTLYDAVVARYSSPATAALSRLILPYLFPDLAAFPTVADLITHLRTSDIRYHAALSA